MQSEWGQSKVDNLPYDGIYVAKRDKKMHAVGYKPCEHGDGPNYTLPKAMPMSGA